MSQQLSAANYNKKQTDLELSDVLDAWKKSIFLELNCHAIATVQSFNSSLQTVTATINYNRTYYQENGSGQMVPVQVPYPVLVDCPVIILGGGSASLTFPISPGDECLILFNDRDIDNWWAGASTGPVATGRLHSFSDGLALVGFREVSNYDTSRALLKNSTTGVGVSTSKVKIYNASTTLNTLLQNLCTAIQNLTVTCAGSGSPSSTPINASTISSIASQIAGLLE